MIIVLPCGRVLSWSSCGLVLHQWGQFKTLDVAVIMDLIPKKLPTAITIFTEDFQSSVGVVHGS